MSGNGGGTRGRGMLWALVALFLGPLAVAFFLYYGTDGWRPEGSTEHGELISPARPLPQVPLPVLDGGTTDPDWLRGQWSLVYFAAAPCGDACREHLHDLRQLRLTFGKDMDRIRRVWIHGGGNPDADWLSREHPDLLVVGAPGDAAASLVQAFPAESRAALFAADAVWVVDPLGNLMMRYPPDTPLEDVQKDLKRLLKLSRIG